MRLWFCCPGCREEADLQERPWSFLLDPNACVVCGAPQPRAFAYLVAKAGLPVDYLRFTARPVADLSGYLLIEADAAWREAVWEQLASGLWLGLSETFDTAVDAAQAALAQAAWDSSAGKVRAPRQRWGVAVRRRGAWQIELRPTCADDDAPPDAVHFTLLRRATPMASRFAVKQTGTASSFTDLSSAVGQHFPGRFRAALASAWLAVRLAK
ncbi:hypothetical protein EKD04_017525 [Chloroflexales bacterium ZM16-3]|nr:hypothetical protein [Chloroflexales bacterium ZM16-3]